MWKRVKFLGIDFQQDGSLCKICDPLRFSLRPPKSKLCILLSDDSEQWPLRRTIAHLEGPKRCWKNMCLQHSGKRWVQSKKVGYAEGASEDFNTSFSFFSLEFMVNITNPNANLNLFHTERLTSGLCSQRERVQPAVVSGSNDSAVVMSICRFQLWLAAMGTWHPDGHGNWRPFLARCSDVCLSSRPQISQWLVWKGDWSKAHKWCGDWPPCCFLLYVFRRACD